MQVSSEIGEYYQKRIDHATRSREARARRFFTRSCNLFLIDRQSVDSRFSRGQAGSKRVLLGGSKHESTFCPVEYRLSRSGFIVRLNCILDGRGSVLAASLRFDNTRKSRFLHFHFSHQEFLGHIRAIAMRRIIREHISVRGVSCYLKRWLVSMTR